MIRTTAQNEKTGEIREVFVLFDGTMYFNVNGEAVEIKEDGWIEQINYEPALFWGTVVLFIVVMLSLEYFS